jgi:dimethylargininase
MIAFLREVSPQLARCELTHVTRGAIDCDKARTQHAKFAETLREIGAAVELVPPLPQQPDGVFVEDAAVVLPEVAVTARLSKEARRAEIESVVRVLGQHRPLQGIVAPGTLEGGDVLRVGRRFYVAESSRTNAEGIAQFTGIVQPLGYDVRTVAIRDCLHLKTACTFVPPRTMVLNPAWVDPSAFSEFTVIPVDEKEPFAANTLTVGQTTLVSASHPKTEKRLRNAGIATRRIDISEFEKAEGGLTCLSLILEARSAKAAGRREAELKAIKAGGVPEPTGHCSQAVVHGGLVYVSPQRAFAVDSAPTRRMPFDEQVEQSIKNLSLVLAASGSGLGSVVRTTIHLADPKHAERVEPIYARMFGRHRPTRTITANRALPAGILIEIEAIAAVTEGVTA